MKKIRDERLILRNLKNIRIVFVIQTLGIVGILGYDLVTKGMDAMTSNPLWPLLMISMKRAKAHRKKGCGFLPLS